MMHTLSPLPTPANRGMDAGRRRPRQQGRVMPTRTSTVSGAPRAFPRDTAAFPHGPHAHLLSFREHHQVHRRVRYLLDRRRKASVPSFMPLWGCLGPLPAGRISGQRQRMTQRKDAPRMSGSSFTAFYSETNINIGVIVQDSAHDGLGRHGREHPERRPVPLL